jgi:hypothetical protein
MFGKVAHIKKNYLKNNTIKKKNMIENSNFDKKK